jgi:predicted amidophosphoribosyltransferase
MWIKHILDYIFPRYCCICEEFLEADHFHYLCETCAKKIIITGENICAKCGHDFGEFTANIQPLCPRCLISKFQFISLRSAVRLTHVTRRLIHQLKYRHGEHLAGDFAKIMQKNNIFMALLRDSALIPVPLHWRRIFKREYNQSEIIAKSLQKLPINIDL